MYRKSVLFLILVWSILFVSAADRYWVGGTGTVNWNTTASWSTTLGGASGSSVPSSSDIVYFDGSDVSATGGLQTGAVTVNLQTGNRTAGQIIVRNSADFTIIDGTGTRRITIGNLTGVDLDIEAGSILKIGGSSNAGITMSAAGTTGTIAGTLDNTGTGTIDLASATITVSNGGLLRTQSALSNATAVVMDDGGTFEDARNPATVPSFSSWHVNSTLVISGYTSSTTAPTGMDQTFGNVVWNCASQTSNVPINAALNIDGDFTITTTNSGSLRLVTATAARNIALDGDFTLTAGTFNLSSSGTSTHHGTMNIKGDFIMNGGTFTESGSSTASGVTFDSTGVVRTFTKTAGTISNLIFFTVASGAIVDFQDILDGSTGDFTNSGAMKITEDAGILTSTANGQIQVTGTRTYNTTGSYHYIGGASQVFGSGLPATVDDLLINNGNSDIALGASLVVSGDLTLTNGSIGIGANTLTLNGNFSGSSSNCLNGGTTSNVTIGGSGTIGNLFFGQSGSQDSVLNNLTLNRSGETITLGNKLKIEGVFTPTAGTLATGDFLILGSSAGGTARIANGGCTSCSYISGNATVQRFIPSSARRWRFLSSTITNGTIDDWQEEVYVTGVGGATNGFDATTSNQAGFYNYNESVITGDLNTGWTAATTTSNSLTPGKGYRMFIRGDRSDAGRLTGSVSSQNAVTLNLIGPVNTGDINMNPTFTSSGDTANDGWNLVGNPYPSQIDWNAFHDAGRSGSSPDFSGTDYAHLGAIAYIYDAATNSYVSYNANTSAGTGSFSTGIIPSGASFFVKAASSSPSMTMKETYKSASAGSAVFKTTSNPNYFTLKLIQDTITSDEMVIIYKDEATATMDQYDIPKLYGSDVNIAAIGSDSTYQSLYCKSFNGDYDTIGLSMGIRKSGEYSIQFKNVNSLIPDKYLTMELYDAISDALINLREIEWYSFSVDINDPNSWGNTRFKIIIGRKETPNTITKDIHNKPETKYYLYPTVTRDNISIKATSLVQGVVEINISDLSGKSMYSDKLNWENNAINLSLAPYHSGIYFIQISNPNSEGFLVYKCIKF